MQTYQIQISDSVADKILCFLNSFKDDVKIKVVNKSKSVENSKDYDFSETVMFSNHSAECIEEWKDIREDSVWK